MSSPAYKDLRSLPKMNDALLAESSGHITDGISTKDFHEE